MTRPLVDFLVIGAQRCGTTTLYDALASSPAIQPAVTKELHYFDLGYVAGPDSYRDQLRHGDPTRLVGEASPYYLFHPLVPARVRRDAPDVRLLVLLRDPVERAWSHYRHEVAQGAETLPFAEAVAAEASRLAGTDELLRGDPDAVSFEHRHFSYAARGRYAEQLERWLELFPPDQLLVLRSEDLYERGAAVLDDVARFLDIDRSTLPAAPGWRNRGDDRTPDPETAALLCAELETSNLRVAALLGRDPLWPSSVPA